MLIWWNYKKEGAQLNLTHDQRDSALVEWAKSEIFRAVDASYELGRFLFTVSAATAAAVVALANVDKALPTDWWFWGSIIALLLAALVAIHLAIPSKLRVADKTNLYEVHWSMVGIARASSILWMVLWLAGVGAAAVWLWV